MDLSFELKAPVQNYRRATERHRVWINVRDNIQLTVGTGSGQSPSVLTIDEARFLSQMLERACALLEAKQSEKQNHEPIHAAS